MNDLITIIKIFSITIAVLSVSITLLTYLKANVKNKNQSRNFEKDISSNVKDQVMTPFSLEKKGSPNRIYNQEKYRVKELNYRLQESIQDLKSTLNNKSNKIHHIGTAAHSINTKLSDAENVLINVESKLKEADKYVKDSNSREAYNIVTKCIELLTVHIEDIDNLSEEINRTAGPIKIVSN